MQHNLFVPVDKQVYQLTLEIDIFESKKTMNARFIVGQGTKNAYSLDPIVMTKGRIYEKPDQAFSNAESILDEIKHLTEDMCKDWRHVVNEATVTINYETHKPTSIKERNISVDKALSILDNVRGRILIVTGNTNNCTCM